MNASTGPDSHRSSPEVDRPSKLTNAGSPADGLRQSTSPGQNTKETKRLSLFGVIKTTFKEFGSDDAMTYAAAVSFYTALSFAPLLVVLLVGLSLFLGPQAQEQLIQQLKELMGTQAGEVARQVLDSAEKPTMRSWAGLISLLSLVFSATGVFAQLQNALNVMWDVKADLKGGILAWIRKRVLSLGMILTVGFLLVVSLVASAVLQSLIGGGGEGINPVWIVLNLAVSLLMFTGLFALMFKYLPDAQIPWKEVWIGAAITAALFILGKWAIGKYLGVASVGSAYGAAGSLLILLVWVYYSCVILFIGAEFTQVWSKRDGHPIQPEPNAVRRSEA